MEDDADSYKWTLTLIELRRVNWGHWTVISHTHLLPTWKDHWLQQKLLAYNTAWEVCFILVVNALTSCVTSIFGMHIEHLQDSKGGVRGKADTHHIVAMFVATHGCILSVRSSFPVRQEIVKLSVTFSLRCRSQQKYFPYEPLRRTFINSSL